MMETKHSEKEIVHILVYNTRAYNEHRWQRNGKEWTKIKNTVSFSLADATPQPKYIKSLHINVS